jgi:NAD(P)-dependent dehydrogenase (short-subunit alcohol dehydrogenase family)
MAKTEQRDPRAGATPPFPEQQQPRPGEDERLQPRADHGEESYRGSGRLDGLTTLVTGADSGIGRAVALAFAREGADVVVSYLEEDADASETGSLVEEAGRRAVLMPGDISDPDHARAIVERTVSELGRIDVLVNNAATQTTHESFSEITDDEVEEVFRTNVFPLFSLCRAAIPHLPAGGAIVNTASIQAYDPSPSLLHYAATKGAIVTFTKGLSKELIESGIRVNAVAPGPVWTPQPAELAPAYVFLASAESRFVTGEVIGVTGGRRLS